MPNMCGISLFPKEKEKWYMFHLSEKQKKREDLLLVGSLGKTLERRGIHYSFTEGDDRISHFDVWKGEKKQLETMNNRAQE